MQAGVMAVGLLCNLLLGLVKLYIGISSNSLAVYCDAVNNFGDALLCAAVLSAVLLMKTHDEQIHRRAESLLTFCIGLVLAVAGIYFLYSGTERILYPLPIAYLRKYAVLLACTLPVKVFLAVLYHTVGKKKQSKPFKALFMDCLLDCAVTLFSLMGLLLSSKLPFAADGVFAVVIGAAVAVSAGKTVIREAKFLIYQ
ncbi:MAG: cation transporter [Candidatus Fimenecus sp.]